MLSEQMVMTTTQPSKIPLGSFDVSCLRHVGRLAVSTQPSACNANNTTGANYRTPSGSAYTWDSSNTAVYAPPRYGSYAVPEVPCTHVMERLPLESACGPPVIHHLSIGLDPDILNRLCIRMSDCRRLHQTTGLD